MKPKIKYTLMLEYIFDLSPGLDSNQASTQTWVPGLKDQPGLKDHLDFVVVAEK